MHPQPLWNSQTLSFGIEKGRFCLLGTLIAFTREWLCGGRAGQSSSFEKSLRESSLEIPEGWADPCTCREVLFARGPTWNSGALTLSLHWGYDVQKKNVPSARNFSSFSDVPSTCLSAAFGYKNVTQRDAVLQTLPVSSRWNCSSSWVHRSTVSWPLARSAWRPSLTHPGQAGRTAWRHGGEQRTQKAGQSPRNVFKDGPRHTEHNS